MAYGITDLPLEVIAAILGHLPDLHNLLSALVTCRAFHTAYLECPAIGADVLLACFDANSNELPLSLAVVAEEAKHLPRPRLADDIRRFTYEMTSNSRQLMTRLRMMPLPRLFSMMRTEEAIVNLAFDFAEDAATTVDPGDEFAGMSELEVARFCRAFYRAEIMFNAFRSERLAPHPDVKREAKRWLLTTYLPHEREQIACVHDYLEKRLSNVSSRVLKEDVELGAESVDYISLGSRNPWKQHWVSQGAYYIYSLGDSFAVISKVLKSAVNRGGSSPFEILTARIKDDPAYFMVPFRLRKGKPVFTNECRDASGDEDTDPGPWIAWNDEHEHMDFTHWGVRVKSAGLREMAFVFWDESRLYKDDLLDTYNFAPNISSHAAQCSLMSHDWMQKSFTRRKDLWQRGYTSVWGESSMQLAAGPRRAD